MSAPDEVLIGPYLARAKIGEGGMGVVYLATDPSGRDVAIKVLRANVVGDDEARARMAREVTSLRRVRSSRVAEVYDADPWGETPYLVTRFVSGPSLHDQVQQSGPLTGMQLRDLTVGLAEAVVAVHAADVVHRDIKPSNVLLQNGNPVLIDFGIAQLADDSKLTSNGWLLGTPGYLAPEILYGGEPSAQADVHSWAATVAYAATGRAPYGSGPAVAVIDRVRRGEHDLSGIPDELRWVLQRSMAPDPAERPTPKQLLVMLTGVPDQTTVHPLVGGAPTTTPYAAAVQGPPSQAQPSYAQPSYPEPTQIAAAHRPMQAPAPAQSSMALEVLFWLGMLALLIAGVVTAPVIGAAGLIAVCWLLRSIAVRNPVTALPATIAHAAFVLLDGASVVLLITVATPPKTHVYALMAGAFVAGLFAWWGPLSGDVRAGGKIVTDTILVPRPRAIGVLAVVALLCIGVFVVHQRSGPTYSPLPDPPWKPLIADHV